MLYLLRVGLIIAALTGPLALAQAAPEVRQLVQEAFEAGERHQELARRYTYRSLVRERKLDKRGEVKQTDSKTFQITHLCGRDYERLTAKNGHALSAAEDRKEQQKLDKCIEKLHAESDSQRAKRLAKEEEEREDRRKMRREILNAFEFRIAGEETVQGAATWRIEAEPKPDYQPEFRKARFLTKLRGTIWISKHDPSWVKAVAETIDVANFGLFLLKLKEGARMELTQQRVNDELWMTDHFKLRFSARVALIRGLRREVEVDWSEFQRFTVDSRILAGPLE